jgi:6-phosphogluconate dehydrogenase
MGPSRAVAATVAARVLSNDKRKRKKFKKKLGKLKAHSGGTEQLDFA